MFQNYKYHNLLHNNLLEEDPDAGDKEYITNPI
jgi:hypothetical protein